MLKKSSPKDGFIKDYSKSYITESNFNISKYPKMKEYYTDLLKNIVIGIDGGGTKTSFVAFDSLGNTIKP